MFVRMPEKDLMAWNTMVFGYVQHGVTERALETVLRLRRMDTRHVGRLYHMTID